MSNSEAKRRKELRREVEALRAQLKLGKSIDQNNSKAKNTKTSIKSKVQENFINKDDSLIIKDFRKTIVLSACAFSIIIALRLLNIDIKF